MSDKTKVGDCLRGDSSLIRPHFTEGLLLQDDDLTAGVTYTRALSRLMFRTVFGCGVLCGLRVSAPYSECGVLKIGIAKGLGLDCLGDPVEVGKPQTLAIDSCKVQVGNELWIALRASQKCCAPRTAACSPDEDDPASVCTRERDGFELRAFSSRPECSCGCAPLAPPPPPAVEIQAVAEQTEARTAASAAAAGQQPERRPAADTACLCNQRTAEGSCYDKFYAGECPACGCDCEWIILAVATRTAGGLESWTVDHSVRRFVRPVLMRDPLG